MASNASALATGPPLDDERTVVAPPFNQAPAIAVPGRFRRGAIVVRDLLGVVAIALIIPFVILGVGLPVALFLRLLLRIGGLL